MIAAPVVRSRNPFARLSERFDPSSDRAKLMGERDAAMADIRSFARHVTIQDALGAEVEFAKVGWAWQFVLLALWAVTKLSVVLKARQLGVSWLAAMYALWVAMRSRGQAVLIISWRQDDADKMLEKVAFIWERLPEWKPRAVINTRTIRFPDLGSEIAAMPASEKIGRSRTANLVILDEHGFQPFARKILLAVKAAAERGQILSISSANGIGALHTQLYVGAKGGHALAPTQLPDGTALPLRVTRDVGPNGWRGVFIPFDAHPDRDAAWLVQARAELAELSDAEFTQEYPRDDVEAIQVTGRLVFRVADLQAQVIEQGTPGEPGLVTYRPVEAGRSYVIGADVSEGLERSDWCSATVLDRETGDQVAQLRGRWAPDVYAAKLDRLARAYGARRDARNSVPVVLAVERNNHGHAVLLRLGQLVSADAGYALYRAKDKRLGWITSTGTRPVLVDQLEAALRLEEVHIHDAGTVDQMQAFAWSDNGKAEAQEGHHDDDVLACGIAVQVRRRSGVRVIEMSHAGRAAA